VVGRGDFCCQERACPKPSSTPSRVCFGLARHQDNNDSSVCAIYRDEVYFEVDKVIPEGSQTDFILISVFVDHVQVWR